MTALLIPTVNSYFAIYTMEQPAAAYVNRGLNWDLHATATDRSMAISHARMLALQPGVSEVHVKQVIEDTISGLVSVKDIKRCKRSVSNKLMQWCGLAAVMATLPLLGSFIL